MIAACSGRADIVSRQPQLVPRMGAECIVGRHLVRDRFRRFPLNSSRLINPDKLFTFEFGLVRELALLTGKIRLLRVRLRS